MNYVLITECYTNTTVMSGLNTSLHVSCNMDRELFPLR